MTFFLFLTIKVKRFEGIMSTLIDSTLQKKSSNLQKKSSNHVAHSKCVFQPHLKSNGKQNYKDSNFHKVKFLPSNGCNISGEEIKILFNQYKLDLHGVNGHPPIAIAGSFCVVGENEYVRFSLVLRHKAKSNETRKRYIAAFIPGALNMTVNKKGVMECKDLKIDQPKSDEMKNYSTLRWLALPLISAAIGRDNAESIKEEDFNVKQGHTQVHNLFDDLFEEERERVVVQFKQILFDEWKDEIKQNQTKISFDNLKSIASEFSKQHCSDLPWSLENAPELCARMIKHVGTVSYRFDEKFFVQRYALRRLQLGGDHDQIVKEVKETIDRTYNPNSARQEIANKKLSWENKTLREELKQAQRPKKFKCKNAGCRHSQWSRVSDDQKWYNMEKEKEEAIQAKERLEMEVAELKEQLQRPAKRQKINYE